MTEILCRALYIFFVLIEVILTAYVFISWLPVGPKVRKCMHEMSAPILNPIRFMLRYSCLYTHAVDISPLIGFVLISYLQRFFTL